MTPQSWMVLIGLAGIVSQFVTAFVVTRVSVAVLEERLSGHRATIDERFFGYKELEKQRCEQQERHMESTDTRIATMHARMHDHAGAIQKQLLKITQLEGEVRRLTQKGGTP